VRCCGAIRGSASWWRTWVRPSTPGSSRSPSALAERHDRVLLDTTMSFTAFSEDAGSGFPATELPRLRDLGDRVLLGTDFPNIPYPYPDALEALEKAGLGTPWLRAVCHDNAARLFAR
jgi:predicted TIM-barrel fold metal-dependent hydrolase